MPLSSPPASPSRRAELGWLITILGLSLVLRLALVPGRWINPDEGAHLMDGRLALDGLLPFVDFGSRQVAYTYVLAALLRLTHDGYIGVRLGLAALTVANVYLVYLIARRLFDGRAAMGATLLYALQPLAVIWSPIVHTEPVTIFPSCLGVYLLIRHFQTPGDRLSLLLTGISLSLAYYARESSLGVTAAIVVVLAAESWKTPGLLLRRYGLFGLGFLIPCASLTLLYLGRLSPAGWWESPLNPLAIVLDHLPTLGTAGPAAGSAAGPAVAAEATLRSVQVRATTLAYLQSVGLFCAGLLAALAASLALGAGKRGDPRWRQGPPRPDILLYAWLGGLGLVYGYWALHRGFFPQYTEEFLPPLSILAGAVVVDLLHLSLPRDRFGPALGLLAAYLVAAFAASRATGSDLPAYACFLIPALALSLAQLAAEGRVRTWALLAGAVLVLLVLASPAIGAPVAMKRALKLATIPVVLAGMYAAARQHERLRARLSALCAGTALLAVLGWSSGRAGSVMDLKYETVWPPETVRTVADLIRRESSEGDRVMSGAVIWELEAGRRPFANVSHPLGFAADATPDFTDRLSRKLANEPPRFVVLDGYTEKTYGMLLKNLPETLSARYRQVLDLPGLHYPVRVYRLREPGPAS
jgi:4-amino-4-deoxy-L-arabinose transferase-like glycosyltransferase